MTALSRVPRVSLSIVTPDKLGVAGRDPGSMSHRAFGAMDPGARKGAVGVTIGLWD
jgi:hypothetical protein